MSLFSGSTTMRVLGGALDGLSSREAAIASNLTNIDTPNYSPVSVDFESALQAELARSGSTSGGVSAAGSSTSAAVGMLRTDSRHLGGAGLAGGTASSIEVSQFAGTTRNDGNQVDLESEMTALTTTQIRYSAVSKLLTSELGLVRDAIGGR